MKLQRIFKSISLLLALLMVISLSFSACQESEGTAKESENEAKQDDGKPIVILVEDLEPEGSSGYLPDVLEVFAKKYSDEGLGEVIVRRVSRDSITQDTECDIFMYETSFWGKSCSLYKMIASHKLADLTPFIQNDTELDLSAYQPAIIDAGKVGEHQMLLPINYTIGILAGDYDVSAGAGLPDGKCLTDSTVFWEKLENWKGDNAPFTTDVSNMMKGSLAPSMSFLLNSGALIDVANDEVISSDESVNRTISFLSRYYTGNDLQPLSVPATYPLSEVLSNKKPGLIYYDAGGAQFYLSAHITNYRSNEAYFYGAVPYSEERGGSYSAGILSALGISEESNRKQRAWDFISYVYRSDDFFKASAMYEVTFPAKLSLLKEQCDTALFQIEFLYGASAAEKCGYTANSLYGELSDIGYAYLRDYYLEEAIQSAFTEKGIDISVITQNLQNYWNGDQEDYFGIYH